MKLTLPYPPSTNRPSDAAVISAYRQTGNVWRAGESLGIAGQTVHKRLRKLGVDTSTNRWTPAQHQRLREVYGGGISLGDGKLDALAAELGRPKTTVCREARRLGLTTQSRKLLASLRDQLSASHKIWHSTHEHPRGMLGKKHTDAMKFRQSMIGRARWASLTPTEREAMTYKQLRARAAKGPLCRPRHETTWKAGWREIGGVRIYARSRWEANYARYLELLRAQGRIKAWVHEPETYWFEGIKRGCCSYLPDFRVWPVNEAEPPYLAEVKGWMDNRSRTKLKRMKKYHPTVRIELIDSKRYAALDRTCRGIVPGWE